MDSHAVDQARLEQAIASLFDLIRFETPSQRSNIAVSRWVEAELQQLGFATEFTTYHDAHGIEKANVCAIRLPASCGTPAVPERFPAGGFAYFAHTDVVPADAWDGPGGAFQPTIENNRLYGRGSCDMKGSLAAMLTAVRSVPTTDQTHPIWITCTADEEIGFGGAKHLRSDSAFYRSMVEAQPVAIVGEPTRLNVVHAHKGITGFKLTSHGRAAHSSTNLGVNANLAMVPLLSVLSEIEKQTRSDASLQDDRFSPPGLAWNFGFSDGMTAINITPPKSKAWCSLRPMPTIDGEQLIARVRQSAASHQVEFETYDGGDPLWTDPDHPWVRTMCELSGNHPPRTASYCTDAGQLTELDALLVCGPGDIEQAHTTDEFIELEQLRAGIHLYEQVLRKVCCQP